MTEKLYPESVVKELLIEQVIILLKQWQKQFPNNSVIPACFLVPNTPNLEGGIEIPTIDDIKAVAISQTIYEKNTSIYIIDNFRRKFEQGANYIIKSLTPPTKTPEKP